MEASLYETLVKALRRQGEALRPAFEKYCSISDPFNVAFLSHLNFKKFGRDTGLVVVGDQASEAAFDLLFTKATNRMRSVNPRLTYHAFIATLARVIVDRDPELQSDRVTDCVAEFMRVHVARAARSEPLPSAEELLEPDVMAVLTKEAGFLKKVRARCCGLCPLPCPHRGQQAVAWLSLP